MPTPAAFLQEPTHRIRFVYTPKHTSWLNQVEIWFSLLVRRRLKRASFTSVDELRERLLAFIDYFNKTMAKPFKWTYAGRPLVAYPLAASTRNKLAPSCTRSFTLALDIGSHTNALCFCCGASRGAWPRRQQALVRHLRL